MRRTIFLFLIAAAALAGAELKIKADSFEGNDATGTSTFSGHVEITMGRDELNASKVTIQTDAKRRPIEYTAQGEVSFHIHTDRGETYVGTAGRAVFKPAEEEYSFFDRVSLRQLGEKKEINGDTVIVNLVEGRAIAEGAEKEPVIMIFQLDEEEQ